MPETQKPTVGRIVHYVARGSKDGFHPVVCRAAIVTEVAEDDKGIGEAPLGLAVMNPAGVFFDRGVIEGDPGEGGTWHWPERA